MFKFSGELDATFVARVKKAAEVFYETPGRSVIIPTGYQAASSLLLLSVSVSLTV